MEKYSPISRLFHWISALLFIGLFAMGIWMRNLGYYDEWYQPAPELHKVIGITFFVWMLARVIWRKLHPAPAPLSSHQSWEKKLAHIVHAALYVSIFIIMMSGYLIATADNRGIDFYGLFEVPVLINAFESQEDWAGLIHEYLAYAVMALVVLHAAGAIKHHVFDKDHTLKRML